MECGLDRGLWAFPKNLPPQRIEYSSTIWTLPLALPTDPSFLVYVSVNVLPESRQLPVCVKDSSSPGILEEKLLE